MRLYNADGHMSAQVVAVDSARFRSDDWREAAGEGARLVLDADTKWGKVQIIWSHA